MSLHTPAAVALVGFSLFRGVWLFGFSYILKTDAARITQLDIDMLHHESWKPSYFGIKRLEVNVTKNKSSASMGFCILVSAGYF